MANYLKGFKSFTQSHVINEMASELTKLGVPKNLMQFIHKLSGEITPMRKADPQLNPATGKMDVEFHTRKEPVAAKKGPWPGREDVPLSHDINVIGTKTGKRNIQHYLEQVVPKDMDTNTRMILVNPSQDQIHYLTRKLGKMSKDERRKRFGTDDIDRARQEGSSTKTGMYMRTVTIDGDSGEPIAAWEGTIGQMLDDVEDDSILYILEKEDRVRAKRTTRESQTKVTPEAFIEYFMKNFEKIASKFTNTDTEKKRGEFEKISKVNPEDFESWQHAARGYGGPMQAKFEAVMKLAAEIKNSGFDKNSLLPKLNNFLELAYKEGEYDPESNVGIGRNRASLTSMSDKHTMHVVASMFLQYVALGKVHKKFHSDDVFVELGLEDLFDL